MSTRQSEVTAQLFPTLKAGVQVISQGGTTYVGFSHRGIEFASSLRTFEASFAQVALAHFDGLRSIEKIQQSLTSHFARQVEISEIWQLVTHLLCADLIELTKAKSNNVPAQNRVNFLSRLTPETNLATWQSGGDLCSSEIIEARANFSILVFGSNRLAISIYSLLLASGFSSTKLIDRIRPIKEIRPQLVCGQVVKTSDIGLKTKDVLAGIKRDSQLNFAGEKPFPAIPSFIVSTSATQPDYIQRWMSEAIAHLLISNIVESRIEIGPIVIPGQSPCFQCLELWRSSTNPLHQKINLLTSLAPPLELPASAVATIAGLAVLHICEFAYLRSSKLIGAIAQIDLLNTLSPQIEYWQPHGQCGCQLSTIN
ncbi:MAG: hypothetical protein NTZ31_03840 [Actinobacteria bacterium]|jgi:hypothetical protein|nr:hypothetical protein [Actinomycetota bacterium]